MSKTNKFDNFVNKGAGNDTIREIPGIGNVNGERLNQHGLGDVQQVQSAVLNGSNTQGATCFENMDISPRYADAAYNALKEQAKRHPPPAPM